MTAAFGCSEDLTRRSFLKATAVLSFAALPALARAGVDPTDGRLLVILLRGGLDGLYAVPPLGDRSLRSHRRDLVDKKALHLDGFFALNPVMANLHDLYKKGQLLIVHGASIPYKRRSHFEGQNMMEGGMDAPYAATTGWLGRALDTAGLPAVTMSLPIPLILRGRDFADSSYPSFMPQPPMSIYKKLLPIWRTDKSIFEFGEPLVTEATSMTDVLRGQSADTPIDRLAVDAAKRMSAPDGPRIGVIDDVGYDSHSREANQVSDKLRVIDNAIGKFAAGLGPDLWAKSLVVTVTEFGRTVAENGAWGTDHGYGTCVFVAGGKLRKSGIVADWPGLRHKNLFEGRDLLATTDARAVYGRVVSAALGLDPDQVRREVMDYPKDTRLDAYL